MSSTSPATGWGRGSTCDRGTVEILVRLLVSLRKSSLRESSLGWTADGSLEILSLLPFPSLLSFCWIRGNTLLGPEKRWGAWCLVWAGSFLGFFIPPVGPILRVAVHHLVHEAFVLLVGGQDVYLHLFGPRKRWVGQLTPEVVAGRAGHERRVGVYYFSGSSFSAEISSSIAFRFSGVNLRSSLTRFRSIISTA